MYLTLVASTHILSTTANFNAKLNKLKQMKTFDHTTLETIYFWSILSSVTYCISLWGCPNSLHAWSGRSVLLVLFIIWSPSIPKNEVLAKAKKCYSLSYLYKKRLACIAYQAYYNLTPPGITNLFTKHVTKHNLRDNLTFDLTQSYWKGLSDSFTHRAYIIWNVLPVNIKSSPSLASFKGNIAKHSKSIGGISFGTSSTDTYKNTDDFIYF